MMTDTIPASASGSSSRLPQPGDGAYLAPARPGDGHFLAQNGSRPNRGFRRGVGHGRSESGRPRGSISNNDSPRGHGAPVPITGTNQPYRNGSDSIRQPQAELRPVVQPRADAAVRGDMSAPHPLQSPFPTDPRESWADRRAGAGGGRGRGGGSGRGRGRDHAQSHAEGNNRDRPAHLDVAAKPFVPPTEYLARLAVNGDTGHGAGNVQTASSSRASSVDGHNRPDATTQSGRSRQNNSRRGKSRKEGAQLGNGTREDGKLVMETVKAAEPVVPKSSRRAAFEQQTKLTTSGAGDVADVSPKSVREEKTDVQKQKQPERKRREEKDDLVSRLTRGLGRRPFLECPICFNSINPSQPIFSCLPPTSPPSGPTDEDVPSNFYQACYTPFHLSCIRDWADRSLAEEAEKIRANNLVEVDGKSKRAEWRCPGCQKRRMDRVGMYKCFCSRVTSPATNGSSPHSCSEPCSRPRPLCSHACPLPCHPGPCPPCQVALIVPCPSHHTSLTVKCAAATGGASMTPVCDEVCGRERGCGDRKHTCQLLCHFGPCAPCTEIECVKCYCGAESREETCGWEKDKEMQCARAPEDGVEEHWLGRYGCGRVCGEKFDCGIHTCEETCHPHPLSPLPCPTSPSSILFCACSQTPLSALPIPPRTKCTDPIPTCPLPCPRSRPCGHPCPKKCHLGECPPCLEEVVRPCRCGESVFTVRCEAFKERVERGEGEMRCERVCKALRNCGRHECSRVCCPLSYLAKSSRSRKKPGEQSDHHPILPGEEDLHTCQLTCGKLLSCGLHTCQRKDHRGACGRCLQAGYDELICHCGETVVYPPVACGTTINCLYPCARPPPSCGHPKSPHNCHESPTCPPCPYLTTRPCACGKDPAVKNVRCSASIVSCGQTCGLPLSCGYHRCERPCHRSGTGECGDCNQVCGKPKRVCKHPCMAACHAPAKCPEGDPCGTIVDQKCACGNLSSRTTCGANIAKGESRETVQLKCNSECLIKQRNARLADALGIKGAEGRGEVEWSTELKAFGASNGAFVKTVEGAFAEFFRSAKSSTILPQMPAAKRTFVMSLAQSYRLSAELIDAEPNRSVMIRRKVDTRIPHPLLSSVCAPPAGITEKKLGGLGNLRAPTPTAVSTGTTTPTPAPWGKGSVPNAWGGGGGSGSLTPATAGSGTVSPALRQSRPTTPSISGHVGHSTVTVPVNQPLAQRQEVVGQVGKVEDDDWDVDQ